MRHRWLGLALLTGLSLPLSVSAGVNRWTSGGPSAGWVHGLAVDPSNPDVVYAATNAGGVLRSSDGGAHWSPSSEGWTFFEGFYWALAIALDPARPSTVYAGVDGAGVFQSTDGGRTWRTRRDGLDTYGTVINGLVIDPSDSSRMFAATLKGVYRSLDAGCTWVETNTGLPVVNDLYFYTNGIVIDPTNLQVLYLSTDANSLWKSVDGGDTWFPSGQGLSYPIARVPAIDPTNPSHLLMGNNLFYTDVGGGLGTIAESDDGGASWHPASANLPVAFYSTVVFDPGSPGTVWAASEGQGVLRSDDSGGTWVPAQQGLTDLRIETLVLAPGGRLFAGTHSAGVARSENGGSSWDPASEGLAASRPGQLAAGVSNASVLFVSGLTPTEGVFHTSDGGQTWIGGGTGLQPGAEGRGIAVDPNDASVAYFGQFVFGNETTLVYKTVDGGATWTLSSTGMIPGDGVLSFGVDPGNSQNVFAGGYTKFYRSSDGGMNWTPATQTVQLANPILVRGGGLPLVALGADFDTSAPYISEDGGDTWTPSAAGLPPTIYTLAADPSNGLRLFAGTVGLGVFVSTDGAASWSPTGGALPTVTIGSLAVDPGDSTHLVAGTRSVAYGSDIYPAEGVLESHDSGVTWAPLNRGLDNPPAFEVAGLVFTPDGGTLRMAAIDGVHSYTFSATPWPAPAEAAPFDGPTAGGNSITLHGVGFLAGAAVLVGPVPASNVIVVDGSTITATVPPGSSGAADIRVTNSDGQYEILRRGFVYDFDDVPPGSFFYDSVAALARAGVTVGCAKGLFCPDDPLTRSQMAVFLEKAIHGADTVLPDPPGGFEDVLRCSPEGHDILQLAFEGITVGCGDDIYCPDEPNTRAQGAVFILKAEHGASYVPPPATGQLFSDVPLDGFAAAYIEQLAAEGITVGCGGTLFCPENPLTRGQAAAYITQALLGP